MSFYPVKRGYLTGGKVGGLVLAFLLAGAVEALMAGERNTDTPATEMPPTFSSAPACPPDAPHGGLVKLLTARAGEMSAGSDERAQLEAALTLIDSYARERADLCRALDSAAVEAASLKVQRDGWHGLYDTMSGQADLYRESWRSALKAQPGARSRLIACGPGGAIALEEGGLLRGRIVGACIFPVWPR